MTFFYDDDIDFITVDEKTKRKIKAYDGNLMIVEIHFEKDAIGYSHNHPHEQACYCLEGEFNFTVDNETKIIKAGDSVYIKPNAPHGFDMISDFGKLLDVFTPIREDFLK